MGIRPCGAKGIRTPDLLIANETRYQLRHSPLCGRKLSTVTSSSNTCPTVKLAMKKLAMNTCGPLLRAALIEDGVQIKAECGPRNLRRSYRCRSNLV